MTSPAFAQLPGGDLVLASASKVRAKILHDAGLGYRCYPVAIDEELVRASASAEALPVGDIAIMLAEMKAAAAVQRLALETVRKRFVKKIVRQLCRCKPSSVLLDFEIKQRALFDFGV